MTQAPSTVHCTALDVLCRQLGAAAGPVERLISARVAAALQPTHLEVVNESMPASQESHFKLFVVAAAFEGVPLLRRHRMVNDAIRGTAQELPCHALSVKALTPEQHSAGGGMHTTPKCGA